MSASDATRDRALAETEQEQEPECRYCKETGRHSVSGGPLIAPCNCKGSMMYVHAEPCLRLWLETRCCSLASSCTQASKHANRQVSR